jgi:anti-sigma B factor antagonist
VDPLVDPLEFHLTSAQVADATYVVSLAGELDLAHTGELDGELELLAEDGCQRLIVDLLAVPFLESTALGILLRHSRRLRMNGGALTLVSDDVRVSRVIEIAGMTSHFRIVPTLNEAIDSASPKEYA